MKKVVLTMALVAMMSVSCKDQAATEETAVEATEAVDTAAAAVDTAAAAVDTAAAAVDSAATEVKEEVKK
jgi:uncharacterized lipoprotein NlpE involved in copper resistance